MQEETEDVAAHYGSADLAERILVAAAEAGVTEITPSTLAPVDEFHSGGIAATRELARFARLQPGESVVDLGCGIGGPARVLAGEFGCAVTGVDLTPEFIATANALTARCGLTGNIRFEVGNALALPYMDGTFDVAWTQHAVMNIRERQGFYNEAARVLKPGGRFVFFDLLLGDPAQPLEYPLPWARTEEISFLHTTAETKAFLASAGLIEEAWMDMTDASAQALARQAAQATPGPFSLQIVMGEDMPERVVNVGRQIAGGKIRLARGLYRKPG